MWLKTDFLKRSSRTLINISNLLQQHTKLSIVFLQCYSMFTFYTENPEPFGSLTKNCPKLDKSVVPRFSVLIVYKLAVSTVQKSNYAGCFNFRQ